MWRSVSTIFEASDTLKMVSTVFEKMGGVGPGMPKFGAGDSCGTEERRGRVWGNMGMEKLPCISPSSHPLRHEGPGPVIMRCGGPKSWGPLVAAVAGRLEYGGPSLNDDEGPARWAWTLRLSSSSSLLATRLVSSTTA